MTAAPVARRMSKSALCSLIFGILGCVPFVTGALAMLLGLIGFVKAGKPGMKGRWMAVVGGLLGMVSVVTWTMGFGVIVAFIMAAIGMNAPRETTQDFLKAMDAGDNATLHTLAPDYQDLELAVLAVEMGLQGKLTETELKVAHLGDGEATVEGTATFTNGKLNVLANLKKRDGRWVIKAIGFPGPSP